MKPFFTIIFSLTLIGNVFSQDTISWTELNNPTTLLNGRYIALDLPSIGITNGDTTIYPIRSYEIGCFFNGKREGITELYFIGKLSDTLASRCEYRNDTVLSSTSFYSNGNPKIINTYFEKQLITTQLYYEQGQKQLDISYIYCKKQYSDYDALEVSYYKNGIVRYIGKMRSTTRSNFGEPYDTWFYYTDCGELYKIEKYKKRKEKETKEYKIKCEYYEWYDYK